MKLRGRGRGREEERKMAGDNERTDQNANKYLMSIPKNKYKYNFKKIAST